MRRPPRGALAALLALSLSLPLFLSWATDALAAPPDFHQSRHSPTDFHQSGL
ncbi:hypothetical protein [Streptomyces sp. NPDC005438]|uniref:hypothetical protein n=1 Tax=Streptomyces sp. NPDC005438 TaxID=3156880 RepID=UPI0033B7AF96